MERLIAFVSILLFSHSISGETVINFVQTNVCVVKTIFYLFDKLNFLLIIDMSLVFENKAEAFTMLKKVRESRVKAFKTFEEAEQFSKCGLESPTETESPIVISATTNGIQSNGTNNNINCDKSSSKGTPLLKFIVFFLA